MLIIDFINNKFVIKYYSEIYDIDIYKEINDYFLTFFLKYSPEVRQYIISMERIDEIILQLSRDNKEYKITDNAYKEIENIKNIESEIKFYRRVNFDDFFVNKKLFEYQKDAILWRLSRNRYLDSLDAGLGKTIISICVFTHLYLNNKIDSIFILTPIGLSYQWKKEILDSVNVFTEEDIIIIDNNNCIKAFTEYQDKKIMIIPNHYKTFSKLLLSYRKDFNKIKKYSNLHWGRFNLDIKEKWKKENIFLIVDECHEFKHSSSIRSKSLNAIINNFDYRALLSATPWINSIEHAYNQINLLDKSILNMNERAFKMWIADEIGDRFSRDSIISYNQENVNEFLNNISSVFDKKLKEDVPEMKTKRLPSKIIHLEMTDIQKKLYQKVIKKEIYKLEEEYDSLTWKLILNKMHIMCFAIDNPFLIKNITTENSDLLELLNKWSLDIDPKFNALKSLLENYVEYQEEKVAVFGIHPDTLDMLYKKFNKYKPLIIHGSLKVKDKEKDRFEKEQLFNNSDENRVIFLSALTSSQGINIHKKCRRIIVYESPDAQRYRQLIDRICRIDSKFDAITEILCIDNSLDNIRVQRNLNRVNFNDRLGKKMSQEELSKLLRGII